MAEARMEDFNIISTNYFKDGYFVGRDDAGHTVVIKQTLLPVNGSVTLEGQWKDHPKYGHQFVADRLFYKEAKDVIPLLLANGYLTGIRMEKSKEMIKTLGTRLFEILNAAVEDPPQNVEWKGQQLPADFVLMQVKGIKQATAKEILISWKAKRQFVESAVVAVQCGLTPRQYHEAINTIGHDVFMEQVLHFPYKLSKMDHFDWKTVDSIAQLSWPGKDKVDHDSPTRYAAALRSVLDDTYRNGNMAITAKSAIEGVTQLAHPHKNLIESITPIMDDEDLAIWDNDKVKYFSLQSNIKMEAQTAEWLKEIWENKEGHNYSVDDIDSFAPEGLILSDEHKGYSIFSTKQQCHHSNGWAWRGKNNFIPVYIVEYTRSRPVILHSLRPNW